MNAEPPVVAEVLTKYFPGADAPAVDSVSVKVVGGRVTGLVGPDDMRHQVFGSGLPGRHRVSEKSHTRRVLGLSRGTGCRPVRASAG